MAYIITNQVMANIITNQVMAYIITNQVMAYIITNQVMAYTITNHKVTNGVCWFSTQESTWRSTSKDWFVGISIMCPWKVWRYLSQTKNDKRRTKHYTEN
jgi:hypothetical protein